MTTKQESVDDIALRLQTESGSELVEDSTQTPTTIQDTAIESNPILDPVIPSVIDSPEAAKEAALAIGHMDVEALKAELKAQIINELKDSQVRKMELEKERRDRETEEQLNYVNKMKESPDPWIDIIGWVKDTQGVRTELQWNDAFVDYLRAEGVTGVDDDAVVQKWVVILMHDMANRMDDEQQAEEPSEFAG